jgi:hypothetical protein
MFHLTDLATIDRFGGDTSTAQPVAAYPHPHGLWSLWDIMLKKAALEFGRALADLRFMEIFCGNLANHQLTPAQQQDSREKTQDVLGNLKRICILSDIDQEIGPELDRFQAALSNESHAKLSQRCDHLRHRIQDELENEFYLQVDRQDVQFYEKADLFGTLVTAKFPKATNDIKNAGNCIGTQQPDACIFHLMRAMEIAVRQLGRRLRITITPQSTWRQMTHLMDDKIKRMPEATERQKRKKNDWEGARANLHQVGSVWRNTTMHPATSYTRSQARDIFNAVRVFMSALCAL